MALIGQIRGNKPLLVTVLGGALFLFIAMLMFGDGDLSRSVLGNTQAMLGEVEGREIDRREFENTYDMLYQNSSSDTYSNRASLWNYFVDKAILKNEAEAVGIGVTRDEMKTLQFSEDQNRLSQVMKSTYTDPNTRQVNMDQLRQFQDIIQNNRIDEYIGNGQLPRNFRERWNYQERLVYKDRLQTKLGNMVSKGLYTPNWMAEMISADQQKKVDFVYVQVPFDEIENSDVSLEDSDYKAYFDENRSLFEQEEETRKVDYVIFDVFPSAKDSADYRQEIADIMTDFAEAEDDSAYVNTNYGSIYGTWDAAYFKKDALPAAIADTVFSLPVGSVHGPYLNLGAYSAVKILDRKVIPDSVTARHILRRASDQASAIAAFNTIDSLKKVIENGENTFEELAKVFSEDQSNAPKGGDLGTFGPGQMVKPFNDVCFFEAEIGKVYSVPTQFGVHLIEVLDKKYESEEESAKIAYMSRDIKPSPTTQKAVRDQAVLMEEESKTLEELIANAAAKGLTVETSPVLKANDFEVGTLSRGKGSRDIVQWAFGIGPRAKEIPEVGHVSPTVYSFQKQGDSYVEKYALASLRSVAPAGLPSYEDVKDEMQAAVINRKKAQMIMEGLQGQSSLEAMASKYASQVDTAKAVTFASPFIPKAASSEPKVVATAFATDLNQISAPVEGVSGVYVVKPTEKPAAAPGNVAQARQTNQQTARMIVSNGLVPTLRKNADIKDNRSKFF